MQNTNQEIAILALVSSIVILLSIAILVYIVTLFNKKQLVLKKNLEILELNHENNILNAQLEVQENTFKHISQEIHDNISLSLTLAKLNLTICPKPEQSETRTHLESTIDLISKALSDLNDISKSLDADIIQKQGLIHAIRNEVDVIKKTGLHQIDFNVLGEPIFLDSTKELLIFRMIQEACNNIIKHANASTIDITISYEPKLMSVNITDNGEGFDFDNYEKLSPKNRSAGIKNICNRASQMNASVNYSENQPNGTKFQLIVPIQ